MSLPSEPRWRPIPGHEGSHEVSDDGQVRRIFRRLTGTRLLNPVTKQPNGYREVKLCHKGSVQRYRVHQLVLLAFVGPPPAGMLVRHLDGNPGNNRLDNLAYGTPSQNNADTVRHGRNPYANKTHCPKGHRYDEANTYRNSDGSRACRACARAYQKRRRELRGPLPPKPLVTHCRHGHEYTPENTSVGKTGKRYCKTCSARRRRETKLRRAAGVTSGEKLPS